MSQEPDKKENVVNLAEARRRQRTVRAGATSKKADGSKGSSGRFKQVWAYVQFLLFLAIIAYLMELCTGHHV